MTDVLKRIGEETHRVRGPRDEGVRRQTLKLSIYKPREAPSDHQKPGRAWPS